VRVYTNKKQGVIGGGGGDEKSQKMHASSLQHAVYLMTMQNKIYYFFELF